MTEPKAFRSQFPVFERVSYLNAGTEGPVPRAAAHAARTRVELEATHGRCGRPYIEGVLDLAGRLRAGYADLLGCLPADVALTGSTTDGVNTVIGGLDLRPGDEILLVLRDADRGLEQVRAGGPCGGSVLVPRRLDHPQTCENGQHNGGRREHRARESLR